MRSVPSFDEMFMAIAYAAASRSKDPSTQVGAVLVNPQNRIISLGYNGTPPKFDDSIFPWDDREEKHRYVIHAERNAFMNYAGSLSDFVGSTLYVTHFPCNECAKSIASLGVSRVIFDSDYGDDPTPQETLFHYSGTTLERFGHDLQVL